MLVNAWLERQRASAGKEKKISILALQQNLDFRHIRVEPFNPYEQFVIIPVRENFLAGNERTSVSQLLLIIDSSGRIRKGNIVQYISESGQPAPAGSFFKLFNDEVLDCSGQFVFLTITGRYLYEMNYKNGVLYSFKLMRPGATISQYKGADTESLTYDACLDWYLMSTVYHDDGGVEIFEDHLGRVLDGYIPGSADLQEALTDEVRDDEVTGETGNRYAGARDVNWFVGEAQNQLWHVRSYETGNGSKAAQERVIQGQFNAITDIAHTRQPGVSARIKNIDSGNVDVAARVHCLYTPAASS